MIRTLAAAAVLTVTVSAVPAYAANDTHAADVALATAAPDSVADSVAGNIAENLAGNVADNVSDNVADNVTWGSGKVTRSLSRPKALSSLYVSYAALQAFDVYSTRQALARGAQEANPLMQGVVGDAASFVAVKAAVGVATIMAAERLWKTNKAAAIAVMVASTGVSGLVAARNARTLRQLR